MRVDDQARPRRQGPRDAAPRARRRPRSVRRHAVLSPGRLLPGHPTQDRMNGTTNVVLLGSTGSIGTQALDVIASHRDRYRVVALAAGRNEELLSQQAAAFDVPPDRVHLGVDTPDALAKLAALPEADVVLNAVVGFAGLPATLAALTHGKRLALANKESLIAGGPVVAKERGSGAGGIGPVDPEPSAIYQALRAGAPHEVRRILLTASGGPIRGQTHDEHRRVTGRDSARKPS